MPDVNMKQISGQLMDVFSKGQLPQVLNKVSPEQLQQIVMQCTNGNPEMANYVMQQLQMMSNPKISKMMSQQIMANQATGR